MIPPSFSIQNNTLCPSEWRWADMMRGWTVSTGPPYERKMSTEVSGWCSESQFPSSGTEDRSLEHHVRGPHTSDNAEQAPELHILGSNSSVKTRCSLSLLGMRDFARSGEQEEQDQDDLLLYVEKEPLEFRLKKAETTIDILKHELEEKQRLIVELQQKLQGVEQQCASAHRQATMAQQQHHCEESSSLALHSAAFSVLKERCEGLETRLTEYENFLHHKDAQLEAMQLSLDERQSEIKQLLKQKKLSQSNALYTKLALMERDNDQQSRETRFKAHMASLEKTFSVQQQLMHERYTMAMQELKADLKDKKELLAEQETHLKRYKTQAALKDRVVQELVAQIAAFKNKMVELEARLMAMNLPKSKKL